jgi:hypothetical protein
MSEAEQYHFYGLSIACIVYLYYVVTSNSAEIEERFVAFVLVGGISFSVRDIFFLHSNTAGQGFNKNLRCQLLSCHGVCGINMSYKNKLVVTKAEDLWLYLGQHYIQFATEGSCT